MNPICPQCRQPISNSDINVATDVAYCRPCNAAHKLSSLVDGGDIDEVDLERPPAGAWRSGSGISSVIGATHRSVGTAIATLFFALFWNGIVSIFIVVALAATLQHLHIPLPDWFPAPRMNGGAMSVGMTIFLWLFLTPFILVGVVMLCAFFSALAGRTEIRIRHTEGTIFSGVGPVGRRRRFNTEAIRNVAIRNDIWNDKYGRQRGRKQIVIEMLDGREIKFGSTLREDRMNFMAASLRQALKQMAA